MRATSQNTSITIAGQLHEFDFITFGSINESEARTVFLEVRAVRLFDAVFFQVLAKFGEIIHLEGKVSEIGLDLDRAAGWKITNFDQLFAAGRFEENEFGAARRFVTAHFFEAEHINVKTNALFEIVHAPRRERRLQRE